MNSRFTVLQVRPSYILLHSPVNLSDLPKSAVVVYVLTLLVKTFLQTEWIEDLKGIQRGKGDRILVA